MCFNKPAREGQLLKIYGIVERVGNTSVTLKLDAEVTMFITVNKM